MLAVTSCGDVLASAAGAHNDVTLCEWTSGELGIAGCACWPAGTDPDIENHITFRVEDQDGTPVPWLADGDVQVVVAGSLSAASVACADTGVFTVSYNVIIIL